MSLESTPDSRPALRLVAVGDGGCNDPLVVESDASPGTLFVRVIGIRPPGDVTCDAVIPASALVPLPVAVQSTVFINVKHRGSVDVYAYAGVGERLDGVRTSTTRLAAP